MNKRALNLRSVQLLVASAILMAALAATPVHALVPPAPHAFFGTLEINGQPAPVGTVVEGKGTNVITEIGGNPIVGNPLTTTEVGKYGSDTKLIIQGSPLLSLINGTPIEFYVNGAKAECATPGGEWRSSFPFQSSVVTELNLRVTESSPSISTMTPTATTQAALPTATATRTPPPAASHTPGPAGYGSNYITATLFPTDRPAGPATRTPSPAATPAAQAQVQMTATVRVAATVGATTAPAGAVAVQSSNGTPEAQAPSASPETTARPAVASTATVPARPRATSAPILGPGALQPEVPSPTPGAGTPAGASAPTASWVVGGLIVFMIPLGVVIVRRRRKAR